MTSSSNRPGVTYFDAAAGGPWRVVRLSPVSGPPLEPIDRLIVVEGGLDGDRGNGHWPLRGMSGHGRYVTRGERRALWRSSRPSGDLKRRARR